MIDLKVYVSDDCWTCEASRRIIADVSPHFPDVTVELINVMDQRYPENVFAVPTYLLNGRIVFLGNPTCQELSNALADAQFAAQA